MGLFIRSDRAVRLEPNGDPVACAGKAYAHPATSFYGNMLLFRMDKAVTKKTYFAIFKQACPGVVHLSQSIVEI